MKETIKLISKGFFKEASYGEEYYPSIKNYLDEKLSDELKENICKYLDGGNILVLCCGVSNDMIKTDGTIAGTPSLLTDGVYVWPGDLSYYVKNYNIKIDSDFVEKMKQENWTTPIINDSFENKKVYIDERELW